MELNLSPENNIPKDVDFEKTILESKAKIHSESQKPVRKGRSDKGRSRKPNESNINQQTGLNQTNINPQNPQINPQQSAPLDLSPYLAIPIEMASKGPARKHGIPELALSSEEALQCAKALNDCFNAFVPNINQMSPKTAAVMGLFTVVGSIGFSKYVVYSEVMEKRQAVLKANSSVGSDKQVQEPELKIEQVTNVDPSKLIPADSYFRR